MCLETHSLSVPSRKGLLGKGYFLITHLSQWILSAPFVNMFTSVLNTAIVIVYDQAAPSVSCPTFLSDDHRFIVDSAPSQQPLGILLYQPPDSALLIANSYIQSFKFSSDLRVLIDLVRPPTTFHFIFSCPYLPSPIHLPSLPTHLPSFPYPHPSHHSLPPL